MFMPSTMRYCYAGATASIKQKGSKPKRRVVRKQKKRGKAVPAASLDDAADEVLQGQQQVLGDLSQVILSSSSELYTSNRHAHALIIQDQFCNVLLVRPDLVISQDDAHYTRVLKAGYNPGFSLAGASCCISSILCMICERMCTWS